MNKQIIVLIALLFSIMSCTGKKENPIKIIKETSQGLVVEYEMDTIRKVKNGFYRSFFPNGKMASEMTYENDSLVGVEKTYHENGNLSGEFFLVVGKYHGDFKYFFESGKLKQEGKYVDNAINGALKTYYENGQLKETVTMEENLEKGPFTEFHENGKLKAKGQYAGGSNSEICTLKNYDENGELLTKMTCNGKGIYCTVWSKEKGDITQPNPICKEMLSEMNQFCKN